jgi:hypothetical protein
MKYMVKGVKAKRKWNRTIEILLFTTVMGTLITLSILNRPPPIPRKPANEYFSFSDVFALAKPKDPQNNSILINAVVFTITAVEGNATNAIIRPLEGNVQEDKFPFFVLRY